MRLTIETAIDLDEKRRVWITGTAEIDDVGEVDLPEVIGEITKATTDNAIAAYDRAGGPTFEKPKEKQDPDLKTFGDDED